MCLSDTNVYDRTDQLDWSQFNNCQKIRKVRWGGLAIIAFK